jgi:hypothetical protein
MPHHQWSLIDLMIEVASTSEKPVSFDQTTRRNNAEDSHLFEDFYAFFSHAFHKSHPSHLSRCNS